MGRHHKKRSKLKSGVSEEREQKKIQKNILKVFQACVTSPGQGGALLVGKSRQSDNIKHKGEKRKRFGGQCRDVGDGDSTDSMSSHGKKTKAVSLSERKRSKKSNKKEIEKETALSRHLRVAHAISDPQIQDKAKCGMSMYTHGRITQKVGLIRTGKKGAPASRGMVIPEHESREIDKEVRKLVLEAQADTQQASDVDVAERLVLSSRYSACSRQSKTPGSTDVRQPLSSVRSVEQPRGREISMEVEHFPKALQLKETVNEVKISIKPVIKKLYPGRDNKRETHIEILKLYKQQNVQRSETPTRLPVFTNMTSSGTIQKSLNKSFTDEIPYQHPHQEKSSNIGLQPHEKQKPTDQTYSFDNQDIFSMPQINFSDINPFQPAQYGMSLLHHKLENGHQKPPVTNSLGSYKRLKQDIGDNPVDMNNNNVQEICMDISCRDKHGQLEHLNKYYSTSKLLDYSRQKLLNEIRTYTETCKHNQSKEVKNLKTDARDEFSIWLERLETEMSSDEKYVNHIYFGVKTSADDDFFLSGSTSDNMPPFPVLHSRTKMATPVSPTLSMDARDILRTNHELKGTSEVFKPMEVDTRYTGNAVGLLVKNDLVQAKTEREQQWLDKTGRNILDDMFDNKLAEDRSRNNSQCSHCSQCSSGRSSQVQAPSKQPNYMPSFHDNYYADQMATGDLSWQQKNSRAKVEAMDILDYAEEQQGSSSHVDCQGDRSSASDGLLQLARSSSMWSAPRSRVTAPPLPLSPGGPKFYPKKLY